jgi:hypothetical protein
MSGRRAGAAPPRIFPYILEHDTGFAPNPFHGWCTLACCKPVIRRTANVGDWIVGITPRANGSGNRVAYAMQVAETLTFWRYRLDPRFRAKRPLQRSRSPMKQCGHNIYPPRPCDRSGKRVLVARQFCYFGAEDVKLPRWLAFAIPKRGHLVFDAAERPALRRFVERLRQGVHGNPRTWPGDEDLCRGGRGGPGPCPPRRRRRALRH